MKIVKSLQITAEEVDFWNKDISLLEIMEKNNVYPPRFVLSVDKNGARSSSVVKLHFEGTQESVKINIILKHNESMHICDNYHNVACMK